MCYSTRVFRVRNGEDREEMGHGEEFGLARRALEGWGKEDQCTSPLEREGP